MFGTDLIPVASKYFAEMDKTMYDPRDCKDNILIAIECMYMTITAVKALDAKPKVPSKPS